MKTKESKYSILLHFVTLCCFLLPFFYSGCGQSAEEKKKSEEKRIQDSIEMAEAGIDQPLADSVQVNSSEIVQPVINETDTNQTELTDTAESEVQEAEPAGKDKDEPYATSLSNRIPILKPILCPSENVYTGLAVAINTIQFLSAFAIFITLFFLILAVIIKFVESKSLITVVVLESFALLLLMIAKPEVITFEYKILWGYWTCLVLLFVLIVYDIYILIQNRRTTT